MNWSEVAEVEELSEPEFTHHADTNTSAEFPPGFRVSSGVTVVFIFNKQTNPSKLDHTHFALNLNKDSWIVGIRLTVYLK